MIFALRPMSTAEILDRTFSLYRRNFLVFAGITILPAALALALEVVGIVTHLTVRIPGRTLAQTRLMSVGYESLVIFVASIVGGAIATGASVYAVYALHLGKPATIAGSYKNVLSSWAKVIVAAVLVFLFILLISALVVIALGFAIIAPLASSGRRITDREAMILGLITIGIILLGLLLWLYLSAWTAFVIPSLLLDKNSILRSFRRSHHLSQGSRGRIFLVLMLALVLTLAFTWTLRLPAEIIFNQRRQEITLELWRDMARFLSTVIAGPIATIAIALFYIDQRIRKEAFDLHLMMQSIEENHQEGPGVQAAGAPAQLG